MKTTTIATTFDITTTPASALKWALARYQWQVNQTPNGVEIYGMSGTCRHMTAFIPEAQLPAGIQQIKGGVDYACGVTSAEHAEELRAQAVAAWALRPFRNSEAYATLDWEIQSPHTSCFGRETLAHLGYEPAIQLDRYMRDMSLSREATVRLVEAYEASEAPAAQPPTDPWDDFPTFEPMGR